MRAASLCHTDLEVIDGSLRYPLPMILGHEASGIVEEVGSAVRNVRVGDHVVLSWNPNCGHCFHCDRDQPILCETYLGEGPKGVHFDGHSKATLSSGQALAHLMFLGAFAEYCVLPAQQAIVVPKDIPFDRSCLIGCGVMTGVGAALNVADIRRGDTVLVIGCGAVGLAAIQGATMAGAEHVIAVDLNDDNIVDVNEYRGNGVDPDYVASAVDHGDSREMRVSLVTRTRSPDVDFINGQEQTTENRTAGGGNDGFRRRVTTSTARLRNVANRS